MSRSLLAFPVWALVLALFLGVPAVVIAVQAVIRRLWPAMVGGEHNDVAGFLIAVVGVMYAVLLAFVIIATWEKFDDARLAVEHEAGKLRTVLLDSQALPEPTATRMGQLVVAYADEVAVGEWTAMEDGRRNDRAFDILGELFETLAEVEFTTPTQEAFLSDGLDRLDDVTELRAERLDAATEGIPSVLWAAIVLGGIITLSFALLFGVPNARLHYLMTGSFAAVIALQILVILVLNWPFAGDVRVQPEPFERIMADFG